MGSGGVACMPLQHGSNNIIMEERFPVQEQPPAAAAAMTTTATTACGGGKTVNSNSNISSADNDNNNNGSSGDKKDNGKVNGSSNGVTGKLKRVKRIIKVKKVVRKVVLGEKKGVGLGKEVKGAGGSGSKEVVVLEKKESGLKTEEKSQEVAAEKKESGLKKEDKSKEVAAEKKESGLKTEEKSKEVAAGKKESGLKSSSGSKIVENGDGLGSGDSKVQSGSNNIKEEVEEGELGTLRWPSKGEIENGEFVPTPEKPRRSEIERGEIGSGKWKKGDIEKGEIVSGNKWRKGEAVRDEIEKGEFIPDRWNIKDEYGYSKSRGRYDMSSERTPPSGKYSSEDVYRRKELSRSGGMRWESGQERSTRISSKIVDEEGSYKSEYSNGKSHEREHASGNRLKRHVTDSDNTERKYYGDYAISKSRRLSEDGSRYAYSEHYSRHSVERFYKSSSYSRVSSSDKYSSRHHEPTLSSKVVYDRHSHSDRSPHDRPRYYDHRDRSPIRYEKSPYGREKTPFGHERSPYGRERSPYGRERSPYWRDRSPDGHDRSPYGREKSPYGRERSPYVLEKSPYDRSSYNEHRKRSPAYFERSPQDRTRHHDRSDRTPSYLERSPHDRARPTNHREASRKGGAHEKRSSQYGNKKQDDKISQKDPAVKDTELSAKESQDKSSVHNLDGLDEKNASSETRLEEKSESPVINAKSSPKVDGPPPEELQSMEEDMDICDTPPHVPVLADTSTGRWFYLDHFGVECGPSKLCELKALVDEGILMSDHFIKHLDSDRWLTIENAVSPLVTVNFPSVVPDVITQLVSPPEAPGNLLADTGDIVQSCSQIGEGVPGNLLQPLVCPHHSAVASEPLEDLQIDERVGALLEGFSVVPGSEIETVGEALQMKFEHVQWEGWIKAEGFTWHLAATAEQQDQNSNELLGHSDLITKEAVEAWPGSLVDKDDGFASVDSADWFSGRWSCKGGDWKRNDESVQDRFTRRKLVLNDGFPLCHMTKSGCEDPRWQRKDDLYFPSQSRKLDLPPWAFSSTDERNDTGGVSKSTLNKPPITRGVKGTVLPVVRINACVVQDHVSETRTKVRGKDRYHSRAARTHSATNDVKRSSVESDSQSKVVNDPDSHGCWKSTAPLNTPKDCLCTADDLQLNLGEWYYLDGAGHEQGPSSFSELQNLADIGTIQKYSSVFRKFDRVWVPITSATETFGASVKIQKSNVEPVISSSGTLSKSQTASNIESNRSSSSFNNLHPQFIGFTRGKLHELVMKSYKNREFAAAINEALDPWIVAKRPPKEIDKHMYLKSEIDARAGKRARMQPAQNDEDYEMEEGTLHKDETTFEQLCGDTNFHREESMCSEIEAGSWGLLDGHMLARVFHFLRSDMKSLVFASLTCKKWRSAVSFYKGISIQVDLSSGAPNCTDMMVRSIMNGYNKEKINAMVLAGCKNITSGMLEEILCSFPCLSSIDIRGCTQLMELAFRFPNISWLKSRTRISVESNSKLRSLKQISERDDFGELKEYFDSVNKRDSANQLFRRSLYKRSKVFDARKSSSILPRDARMRRWAVKKSENSYKRMEGFLASGLKDIMKENTFDFFVPKLTEIEDRMKSGYYVGHGLRAVKEDISRMCRDAIKVKNRGAGDMNHIITLFLQLASRLEESSKFSYERDELMKSWKDDLSTALDSAPIKHKKKAIEKKYMNRSNGTILANGSFDFGEYASDREIKKRISKLNRKSMDSGSETSDDRSSEDGRSGGGSTASDTESDLDFRSEGRPGESRGDEYFMTDEDEREWGARMTNASLVPPVTRKYEVIDQYVIVADEEDVQRKMSVSLPDDYAEKLDAQKNGTEELDMELPEVKDYKPRKQLGDEVIEQEVYGIDPYTHNLLLDSMPEEVDWPLSQKHMFIEDVLLCTLNKQVRHYTGAGNTPMTYPLQPVVEEIEQAAMEDCDTRTMKICRGILRAIDSRPDDKYVAYRKGLGVVCNKEAGFRDDDFVVEFLGEVYPAWKWFEKQDGIRLLQKDSKEPAPEFYNIYLERPKGDADGYDLVVVDAMHKANYASRICHSCKPNCEAKVTAVGGQYQIGIYSVREIQHGEEITFDYNSVTESKEEYEASVCLCGSQVCRGSYLNLTGEGAFQKVLKECHGLLDRHYLMLGACELNSVSEEDYLDLGRAGLGSCLLGGLPDWVVAYSACLVRFINLERTKLPEEILRHNLEEKKKYFADICIEVERSDAEVQAEGVYNQRLQNLAVTLDKVRYVMRCIFGDPKLAPPPLEKLTPEEAVSFLWKEEGSLVEELLQCMSPHMDGEMLNDLKSKIYAHDPSDSDDIPKAIQKSLLWLRDEVRSLPCTYKCRHDAAADLIHVYAYTKSFFRVREYDAFTSPPVSISPLDLGPKCADKLGGVPHKYQKTYGENYCMGQLIFWHIQTNTEPDSTLAKASKGCLSLPDIGSFYSKVQKPSQQRIYGPKTVKMMLERMEKYPQKPWPKDQIWSFKSSPKVFGSPMLDAVLNKSPLDREMVHWLKHRPTVYQAMWDR